MRYRPAGCPLTAAFFTSSLVRWLVRSELCDEFAESTIAGGALLIGDFDDRFGGKIIRNRSAVTQDLADL